jgi:hypothetical protein
LPAALVAILFIMAPAGLLGQANPAHAHIGHVADGWRGTPDGMGLLPTATAEARIAAQHAQLAVSAGTNLAGIKTHTAHVQHAINPEAVESGPGMGYGVLPAARGAVTHIGLASQAEGASDNVKLHATHISTAAGNAVQWSERALGLAEQIQSASDASRAAELAQEMHTLLQHVVSGHDANGDGNIGWQEGEGGLQQAQTHLTLLKRGEGMSGG